MFRIALATIIASWLLLTTTNPASATCSNQGSYSACNNMKIEKLWIHTNGNIYVDVDDDTTDLNCTVFGGKWIALYGGSANFEEIYSLLLATFLSKNEILQITMENNSSPCKIVSAQQSEVKF